MAFENDDFRISEDVILKLKKIKESLNEKVVINPLGFYKNMSGDELWLRMVNQFCVMGGSRMIDNLSDNSEMYSEFKAKISLGNLSSQSDRASQIETILKTYKATRFSSIQGKKINKLLDNPLVVNGGQFVMLSNIDHSQQNYRQIRNELRKRNPYFGMKSASDFMIGVGLSHDVIALDTRIVGLLNKNFSATLQIDVVQRKPILYEKIENTLRRACDRLALSLAELDQMLFKYSGMNAIEYIINN